MRILVVTQHWDYINPTLPEILRDMESRAEFVLTGWGFRDKFTRVKDIEAKYGKIDAAIIDPWVLTDASPQYYADCRPVDIVDSGIPLILNLIMYDVHGLDRTFFDTILAKCRFALSTVASPQFWRKDFSTAFSREAWLKPTLPIAHPSVIDDRFLMLPHAVAEKELYSVRSRRAVDVSVQGVGYSFRRAAIEALSGATDLSCRAQGGVVQRLAAMLATDYYKGKHLRAVPVARWLFRRALQQARCGVTCDGSIGYPVRKFFEIPAAGAVLMAHFFNDPGALGFRNGENAIFLQSEEAGRIPDLVRWLKSDSKTAIALAGSGQELIRNSHMVPHRVDHIIELAGAIASNRLTTTRWKDGHPVLVEGKRH